MIFKRVIIISLLAIVVAIFSYWFNFGFLNSYPVSNKPEDWALLADFFGGILNPILTFLTIVLLVGSLSLQRESNSRLKLEIEKGERFEVIRSFESSFYNMIDSQRVMFDKFKLDFIVAEEYETKHSYSAVIELEALLAEIKAAGGTEDQIVTAIHRLDQSDEIYSLVRAFCVIVKLIEKRLGGVGEFTKEERMDYYETLINFTDYPQIRLVLICYKYLDYSVLDSLRNDEFISVLKRVGAYSYLSDV